MDAIIRQYLQRFRGADLIREIQVEPELEYWFKHVLIQEVMYDSLLKSARIELHSRVAGAIERLHIGQDDERSAVLALHYERAGQDERAFHCTRLAGERARSMYAHQEALDFYDRALAAAQRLADPHLLPDVWQIYIDRGNVLETKGDHRAAVSNYREMLAVARETGQVAMQSDALNHLLTMQVLSGGGQNLAPELDEALAVARRSEDLILVGRALWNIGLALRFQDAQRAVQVWQQALDLAQNSAAPGAKELTANILVDLSIVMVIVGQMRQGLAYVEQAEKAFRELGNQPLLADALGGAAFLRYMQGQTAEARLVVAEGLRISQAIGNPWGVLYNEWALLEMEMDAGQFDRTLATVKRRLADARGIGFVPFAGILWMQPARAWLELGQCEQARTLAEESVRAFEEVRSPLWSTWGRGFVGHVMLECGDLARAHTLLDGLWQPTEDVTNRLEGFLFAGPALAELALADYHSTGESARLDFGVQFCDWFLGVYEPQGAHRLTGEVRYLRGLMYLACGDQIAAEADLVQARQWLIEAEAATLIWRVDAALVTLFTAMGDVARAQVARSRAVELIHRLADRIGDPMLRASFLARSDVREALA